MIWWLAGCAHTLGVPDVVYGESLPIPIVRTSIDRRWYVPMTINGEPWVWFFDTGYSHSTCDDGLIEALDLETRGRTAVRGEIGRLKITKARLPNFLLGGHEVEGLVCQVRDLNTTSSIRDPREVRIAGVLGMDVLRPFDVEMDPLRGQIWLRPPGEGEVLDSRDAYTVKIRREWGFGTRMKVPATIQGRTLWPILDTGASSTHLDLASIGKDPSEVKDGVVVRGTGGSGSEVRTMSYFHVPSVALNGAKSGPVRVAGRDRGVGLLGLDVLGNFRATYDFQRGLARFEPMDSGVLIRWSEWWARGNDAPGMILQP